MRLQFTRPAARDLEQVLDYLAFHSPQGAHRVQQRIQAVLRLLAEHPNAGSPTNRVGMRRFVVYPFPYLIFYRVTRDAVVIHGVRHAARQLD